MTSPEELIQAIEILPSQLESILLKIDDSVLDKPIREGAWTARQVLNHLADSHINSYVRIKLMLTEELPRLKAYNEKLWAELYDCKILPTDSTLKIIQGVHYRIAALLKELSPSDWERKGIHGEVGEITLLSYVKIFADHGIKHLDSLNLSY